MPWILRQGHFVLHQCFTPYLWPGNLCFLILQTWILVSYKALLGELQRKRRISFLVFVHSLAFRGGQSCRLLEGQSWQWGGKTRPRPERGTARAEALGNPLRSGTFPSTFILQILAFLKKLDPGDRSSLYPALVQGPGKPRSPGLCFLDFGVGTAASSPQVLLGGAYFLLKALS